MTTATTPYTDVSPFAGWLEFRTESYQWVRAEHLGRARWRVYLHDGGAYIPHAVVHAGHSPSAVWNAYLDRELGDD